MPEQPQQLDKDQLMQVMQQKLGNLEITLNALMGVLQDKGEIDQEEINEKAQEIVQEARERQEEMQKQAEGE